MQFIRGLYNLPDPGAGCVATIGNFDGVHRGHQAVIEQCLQAGRTLGLPVVLVTFEPQPREYFAPHAAPSRLTRLREKLEALRDCGLDRILCLRFDRRCAQQDPEDFIRAVLVDGLRVRQLVVGDDFCFGRNRAGNFSLLEQAGERCGFRVERMHTFNVGGARVSSTRVRAALAAGDLRLVQELLGRPYALCGRVAHGDKRGRTIGFPTANVALHRATSPVSGVFAVRVAGLGAGPVAGVANIGQRPTVDGTRTQLEVHLFNFDRDIYGAHVQVNLVEKLREERRFDSFDELRWQIMRDAQQARALLCMQGPDAGGAAPANGPITKD
jgi:riboflavin kinase/FMN adenylyltransferase